MGPGAGAQRGGGLCQKDVIMTALAPLESRHPRLGQSLWRLWDMSDVCVWGGGSVGVFSLDTCTAQKAGLQHSGRLP